MLFVRACKTFLPAIALIGTLSAVPASANRTHRAATSGHKAAKKNSSHQVRGQRQIDPDRAREIQGALIREHYLSGEPSGQWDAQSQAAMVKFQADQGWQTKLTPDSRALIKLGLGPKNDASKTLSGTQIGSPVASSSMESATGANALANSQQSVSQ
jgi:hypothetical protein